VTPTQITPSNELLSLPELNGYGRDIAFSRADDLDLLAVQYIKSLREENTKARIHAVDVGYGLGGQMIRMARAGASLVTGIDVTDHRCNNKMIIPEDVAPKLQFIHGSITLWPDIEPAMVISCQRMIHYLPFPVASTVLWYLRQKTIRGGRLYISATGIETEIGKDYPAADKDITERFSRVSEEAAAIHSITKDVCLYTLDELTSLVTTAGWRVMDSFTSQFGNHKVVAT